MTTKKYCRDLESICKKGHTMEITDKDYAFLLTYLATDEDGKFDATQLNDAQNQWLHDYNNNNLAKSECPYCHAPSKPGAHYCHSCGYKLD